MRKIRIGNKTIFACFEKRLNRFEGIVTLEGRETLVHIPNTGRCRELLRPGARVLLEQRDNPGRKTKYELIMVYKAHRLISIDSQAPNRVAEEAVKDGVIPELREYAYLKREYTYGNSRFDLFLKKTEKSSDEKDCCFVEVKGVTLEEADIAMFPDAPTERGTKHIYELIEAVKAGYKAVLLFVIQMEGIRAFTPNARTDKPFTEALKLAGESGVEILAYACRVTEDGLSLSEAVPVILP